MDESRLERLLDESRLERLLDEVHSVVKEIASKVVKVSGTNTLNTTHPEGIVCPPPPLVSEREDARLTRVLRRARGLSIPTPQILEVWLDLVALLPPRSGRGALREAVKIFNQVSFGVHLEHATTFDVVVRFLFLASVRYDEGRLPVRRGTHQILLGRPGAHRIGIEGSIVHSQMGSRRLAGVRPMHQILGEAFPPTVRLGPVLSSLVAHTNSVCPYRAKLLTNMCAALPDLATIFKPLILSYFKVPPSWVDRPPNRPLPVRREEGEGDEEDPDENEEPEVADPGVVAFLNRLSETYV